MPQILKLHRRLSDFYYEKFPAKFKWGSVSPSSSPDHHLECSWNDEGRRSSWWDSYFRKNSVISTSGSESDSSTCDEYNNFEEDVMLLKSMHATCYQFTLSWSRMIPNGNLPTRVNKFALDHYNGLINTLIENDIEPIVTLYDWDLPEVFYEKYPKGWQDEGLIKEFGKFAQICFKRFGDRVKRWITIHDPWTASECASYGNHHQDHLHHSTTVQGSPYKIYSNLIKAHSLAYKIYQKGFRRAQQGKIGISINAKCVSSACLNQLNTSVPHNLISEISGLGSISMDPNPKTDSDNHASVFNWAWLEVTKNPSDFISLIHDSMTPNGLSSSDATNATPHSKRRGSQSLSSTREILLAIKEELGNPEVLVCGKGLPLVGHDISSLVDLERIEYFKSYADEVLKSVMIDGCNVIGFLPGTLVDCPEWDSQHEFVISYGLHHVNFKNPEKSRTPRTSAKYLAHLFKTNEFSDEWDIGTLPLNFETV